MSGDWCSSTGRHSRGHVQGEVEQLVERVEDDSLDFLAKAEVIAGRAPLLVVSGELDHPALRADALCLVDAVGERAELLSIPGLAHPLADESGIEPAPQLPLAREVDAALTTWFRRQLADAG